jgi:predicted nucleotidyltransferase
LWERAASDCKVIIDMIAREYYPTRVYQWGSLLRPERFRDYSDIDIAVEGIGDAEMFFHMLGAAQAMTEFDLDLVQIEKVVPEYAEDIREYGKIAYERR